MVRFNRKKNRNFSSRNSKKSTGNLIGRILYWLCLIIFIGSVFYVLFFSSWTKILEVSVSGTEYLNEKIIQESVWSQVEGKYLNLVEKNNYLLISEKKTADKIAENFLKIKEIKIDKKFPNKLIVNLKERDTVFVFCRYEKCFVIDEEGMAFSQIDKNNLQQFGENILILQSEKGREVEIGDFVLDKDFSSYLLNIKKKLEEMKIKIEKETYTAQLISGNFQIKTQEGWYIYFNKNVSLEKEIKMLESLFANQLKDVKKEDLDYIDLRSDKKVYYKFKSVEDEKPSTDSTGSPQADSTGSPQADSTGSPQADSINSPQADSINSPQADSGQDEESKSDEKNKE